MGYGGCEPRIEGIVQCTKRYCTILRKLKKCGGWEGEGQYLNIFFLNFTKYSTHHSLSANTGFKSLAFILFEILHLQNCDVKF